MTTQELDTLAAKHGYSRTPSGLSSDYFTDESGHVHVYRQGDVWVHAYVPDRVAVRSQTFVKPSSAFSA